MLADNVSCMSALAPHSPSLTGDNVSH